MAARIDALRVAYDLDYAASLNEAQWQALILQPDWQLMWAENMDILEPVLTRFGARIGYFQQQPAPARVIPQGPFEVIGKAIPRMHGFGHVTGFGQFTEHKTEPGMLFMRELVSPHPHAKIRSIDASEAEKLPGVAKVLHRGNAPKEYLDVRIGSGPPDRFIYSDEVFEVGTAVASVAAVSDHVADEALRLIKVDYEILPAVTDHIEAMKPSTPKQWNNKLDGTILEVGAPKIRGNPDQGFAESEIVIENVTTRSSEQHAPLEPTTLIVKWDTMGDGRDHVTINGTFRHPHGARNSFAQALKLDQAQVRVIVPGYMGSSYGAHRDPQAVEYHAAIMAKVTGRPVRAMNTRAEDFINRVHRSPVRNENKIGVKRDGTIVAFNSHNIGDSGAQRGGGGVGYSTGLEVLYNIPN
jgi:xanthine dehydrogenase molybdenum-binding subunit